ncbi:MAG: NYN domain-containing protein [Syntrophales bacterium]
MHIIVDGYNLIRQSDTFRQFEKKSLEEGRNALLRSLAGYRKLRGHHIREYINTNIPLTA